MACYIHRHPDTVKEIFRIGTTYDAARGLYNISDSYLDDVSQQWFITVKDAKDADRMADYIADTMRFMLKRRRIKADADFYEIIDRSAFFDRLVAHFKQLDIELEIKFNCSKLELQ
jgi:hypothetical protein